MLNIKKQLALILNAIKEDYVIEQGTDGIWTYRKWNSGIAECWGVHTAPSATFSVTGSVYYRSVTGVSLPFTLMSTPTITATSSMGNVGAIQASATTTECTFSVMSAVATARAITINIYVKGTWK